MSSRSQILKAILLLACLIRLASPAAKGADFDAGTTMQPLQAWSIARDGAVFVLDAAHIIHQLDPFTLASVRRSASLADGFSGMPAFMLATESELWVGSNVLGETIQLTRDRFEVQASISAVGPMALDPGKALFVIEDRGLTAHNLTGSLEAPKVLMSPWERNQFVGDVPLHMLIDPDRRRLYVTYYGNYGSPPHNREYLVSFDLDTLAKTSYGDHLGQLSPPTLAVRTGQVATVVNAKNGLFGSRLLIYEPYGELGRETPFLQGEAVLAPDGQWIYLLRNGGLWTLRTYDGSLASILPVLGDMPRDMLISNDGARLYLFGNGWATSLSTDALQEPKLPSFRPLPSTWQSSDGYHLFEPAGFDDHRIAFTLGSDGEIYRTEDGAKTWTLIADSLYPQPRWITRLSLSPEFAQDGVAVARPAWDQSLYHSNDAGLTWQPWLPRLAFTSDRDGNREIYTADAQGQDLRRLTNDAGVDENPAWSPGWTRIVFQSDRNGNFDIYSVRADCDPDAVGAETLCDLRQLTDDPADDLLPAWSPDSTRIAFVSLRDGNPEIYVMDQDGSDPRRITFSRTGDWRPAWTEDSHAILFTSDRNGDNDIFRIQVPHPEYAGDPGTEAAVEAMVATVADERDAAINTSGDLLFLSDHAGEMEVWRLYSWDFSDGAVDNPPYRPYKRLAVAGGHPAWLDIGGTPGFFLSVGESDSSDIIFLDSPNAEEPVPFVTFPGFDGHPAAGPVWWDSISALP